MRLSQEQSDSLSLIFPYELLDELSKRFRAGLPVTYEEKRGALLSKVEPHKNMLLGNYTPKELGTLCVRWRIFFQLNYPDMFRYHIHNIESIQAQLNDM